MEQEVYQYDFRLSEDQLPYLIQDKKCTIKQDYKQKNSPRDITDWANEEMELAYRCREIVVVLCFNTRNVMLGYFPLTEGSADAAMAPTRDIYMAALSLGATQIVVIHNHPSGFCDPSEQDIAVEKKVLEAGKLLDINLMDFMIVGRRDRYFSFSEAGML